MSNICVLIPSYNEARTIGHIIKDIRSLGLDAYVVDDGSSDNTASIAESEGAAVLRHEKNMGKGASLKDGFKNILKRHYGAVIVMDGDNQHEVASIPGFIKTMEETGADIIMGNRMLDTRKMPYVRKQVNSFMSYLISKICGQDIPDTQCGYRMIKRRVLENIALDFSNFETDSELLVKASRRGFRISSMPIRTIYRDEKSKINPVMDTLRFIAFVIKMMVVR